MAVAGFVVFLWMGGKQGTASLIATVGIVVYFFDVGLNPMIPCTCDGGKKWSPLTKSFRFHKRCGGKGIRRRPLRELFDKRSHG